MKQRIKNKTMIKYIIGMTIIRMGECALKNLNKKIELVDIERFEEEMLQHLKEKWNVPIED